MTLYAIQNRVLFKGPLMFEQNGLYTLIGKAKI